MPARAAHSPAKNWVAVNVFVVVKLAIVPPNASATNLTSSLRQRKCIPLKIGVVDSAQNSTPVFHNLYAHAVIP